MKESEQIKMAQSLQTLKDNLPMLIDFAKHNAKVTRAKYDAFISEGFSPEQAITLCK